MNIAERIQAWKLKLQAAQQIMLQILTKAETDGEGRTLTAEESTEHDAKAAEVVTIKAHLVKLEAQLAEQATIATPVVETLAHGKAPAIIVNRNVDDKFKGQSFTRMAIAQGLAGLFNSTPSAVAAHRWGKTNPLLVEWIRANEVAGGGSGSGEWGAELVTADNRFVGDFVAYLNSRTIFNQLPLREVPANITIKGADGAATGYWVGESKAIPVTTADFVNVSLTPLKAAALAVVSNELLRDSSPAAEALVRDALVEAAAQRIDTTFLSATAASAGVSPAGLFNGVTSLGSNGFDADAVREDFKELVTVFLNAKNGGGLYSVTSPTLALALSLMFNTLGNREFPEVSAEGGKFLGYPLVTGENTIANSFAVLKPSDIWKIGDGAVQVSVSRDATIEMSSAPVGASDTPTGQTQNPVNMFQSESTAFKVVRSMNFAKRRTHAAQIITDAYYGNSQSMTA